MKMALDITTKKLERKEIKERRQNIDKVRELRMRYSLVLGVGVSFSEKR
jgi:hypothetical protein